MSRHRRQASQVLPPEIISGEDLSKPFDVSQVIAAGTTSDDTPATKVNPHAPSSKEKGTHLGDSPATAKKPPAGKSG
ncbi:hypothetical protein L6164_029251 [Bauhinia variegata]|uniref:Uncharacterized protein n=1 Tax=Bauhinia variegata TaxID=167791 RepID=A0ACB9L8S5_BAUVA|nr:hypothetical protein L6164_029251 [Bauhinia variegata]